MDAFKKKLQDRSTKKKDGNKLALVSLIYYK
jgi:hypothetical protein